MAKKEKLVTIYKNFQHDINLKNNFQIGQLDCYITDFSVSTKIIGTSRLVIYGSYQLVCKSEVENNEFEEKFKKSFREIINIELLHFDYSDVRIKVNMVNNPELVPRKKDGLENIYLTNSIRNFFLRGQLCCRLFDNSQENDMSGYDVICIASTRWDYIWQRPHHLMERMSRNNRVLFFSHSLPVSYQEIKKSLENPNLWESYLTQVADHLWVFGTIHLAHGQSAFLPKGVTLKEFNFKVKSEALKFLVKKLQFTDPIIITSMGESIRYIQDLPKKIICYDCIDDFSSFSWTDEDFEILEKELIQESDLVFASAKGLYNRIKPINKNTFLLPNAVEFQHFAKAATLTDDNQKLINFSRPIIGYIGAFFEWVDEDLIHFLAQSRPDWNFIFIGPIQPGMGEVISKLSNITFLGVKDYKDLPDYLAEIDVCIIPFKINDITRNTNPIKLWEYLAAGKPIITTPIPEVEDLSEIIYIGRTRNEFLAKLDEALHENASTKQIQRMAIAEENDWDQRVKDMIYWIKRCEEGE